MNRILIAALVTALFGTSAYAQSYPGTTPSVQRQALEVIAQVDTTADLKALSLTGMSAGDGVLKTGYYTDGDMPAVTYYLQTSACDLNSGSGDGGAEIPSNTAGNCWHIAAQTQYDPRWWGAKADVTLCSSSTVTTTSGSGAVVVSGGKCPATGDNPNFTSADIGKKIVITDVIGGTTAAGASYAGAITAVTNTTHITVSPTVGFTTASAQDITYGTDSAAAFNSAVDYVGSNTGNLVAQAQPIINLGGGLYGVASPITFTNSSPTSNLVFRDGSLSALGTSGFSCATGILNDGNGFMNFVNVQVSSSFLPVNGLVTTVNGQINLTRMLFRNWYGACASKTVIATATSGSNIVTVTSVTGLTNFMVSRGNANVPDRALVMDIETSTSNTVCPGKLCIVLNRAVTGALSSASITLYQDAFGAGVTNSGGAFHVLQSGFQQYSSNDTLHPLGANDNTGCGIYHNGTQSDVIRSFIDGGVANICLDSSSLGIDFYMDHAFNVSYPTTENNAVTLGMASGAQFTRWFGGDMTGAIQYFMVGTTVPSLKVLDFKENNPSLSPDNLIQFYGHGTNISLAQIAIDPYPDNKYSHGLLNLGGVSTSATPVCGTDYSYAGLTCTQDTAIAALTGGFMLPTGGNGLSTVGLSMLNGTLQQSLVHIVSPASPYNISAATDCPSDILLRGSATSVQLPNNASLGCNINIVSNITGASITLQSGAIVNGAATSIALTRYIAEICFVGGNADGVSAQWFCK